MAIIITFDFPGATQEQYEQVTNEMTGGRGVVAKSSDWPVEGLILHTTGPSPTGWFVCDVWESEEAFQRFGEKLAPLLVAAGMPNAAPTVYPAVNTVTS
ncbi:MAG: hypothetical protein HOV83_16850 [Catenulispora sp.]|nr:hypothetical protein [Catenulispora sp.]